MAKKQEEMLKEMEETQTLYLDQIEELTHQLSQAESKISVQDSSRMEEGAKVCVIFMCNNCSVIMNVPIIANLSLNGNLIILKLVVWD